MKLDWLFANDDSPTIPPQSFKDEFIRRYLFRIEGLSYGIVVAAGASAQAAVERALLAWHEVTNA